jgi:hypothetical protein
VTDRKISWYALVRPPKGFTVKVSPRLVKLEPGESATVTMEITNVRAPVDEWRFGSLTWWGGGYKVTSPVAVKGAALAASAEVTGSGTEGSASFDVSVNATLQ